MTTPWLLPFSRDLVPLAVLLESEDIVTAPCYNYKQYIVLNPGGMLYEVRLCSDGMIKR